MPLFCTDVVSLDVYFQVDIKGECPMGRVKVFLSFEFDRDNALHRNFYALAARDSCRQLPPAKAWGLVWESVKQG